jgi:hypothetical protein
MRDAPQKLNVTSFMHVITIIADPSVCWEAGGGQEYGIVGNHLTDLAANVYCT